MLYRWVYYVNKELLVEDHLAMDGKIQRGCIVLIDAIDCQKEMAQKIVNEEVDYVLTLKDNHKHLYERVNKFFSQTRSNERG